MLFSIHKMQVVMSIHRIENFLSLSNALRGKGNNWFCWEPLRKNGRGGGINYTIT